MVTSNSQRGVHLASSTFLERPAVFHVWWDHKQLSSPYRQYRSPIRPSSQREPDLDRTGYDEMPSMSSLHGYPADKPFINDDHRRTPTKPVSTLPEGNRQGVMSALKGLQDKIRKLELERTMAEDNLRRLATDTNHYRDILQRERDNKQVSSSAMSKQTQELESQLGAAENRCNLLEKQLEYMRKMVSTAEQERNSSTKRAEVIQDKVVDSRDLEQRAQLEKLTEIQREHLKLTANQTMAENKIRELEEKLQEERHHRKLIQERSAELETAAETNRILLQAATPPPALVKKKVKKKKKKVPAVQTKRSKPPSATPADHYRLNLAEIPFVAGKATTPSHSVAGNVQKVIALMKSHNPALCAGAAAAAAARKCGSGGGRAPPRRQSSSSSIITSSSSSESDLMDLLLQLQDEFGHMSFEHQELVKQMKQASNYRLKEDLERELESLVARMEAKGEQITRLKRHQQTLHQKKSKKKSKTSGAPRPFSASARLASNENGEVEVTTTVRTKGRKASPVRIIPTSITQKHNSLNVLKDMKKIQTSLRKDDVSWDC